MAKTFKPAHAGGDLRVTAQPSNYVPSHYLRRVARSIVIRAAMRARISWPAALVVLNKIGGAA